MNTVIEIFTAIAVICGILSLILQITQKKSANNAASEILTIKESLAFSQALEERRLYIQKEIYSRANRPISNASGFRMVLESGCERIAKNEMTIPKIFDQHRKDNCPVSKCQQYKETMNNGIKLMLED